MRCKQTHIFFVFTVVMALLLNACSNTKHLSGDQTLYAGRGKVVVVNKQQVEKSRRAALLADDATSYKPNGALFGNKRIMPSFGLWTYNYLKPKGKGKVSNWFYRTVANEPVLISKVNPELRCRNIENDLFNIGYFNTKAWYVLDTSLNNPRKAKISYFVQIENPYRIGTISFLTPTDELDNLINSYEAEITLKTGTIFNLDAIKEETSKITNLVLNKGYFFFKSSYIQIIADTSAKSNTINLLIGKSKETPAFACHKYTIENIIAKFRDVPVDSSSKLPVSPDTIILDGVIITGLNNYLNPEVISRNILFRHGDLYSSSKHQGTIQRINNNGVFKSVRMQFNVTDTLNYKMDMIIDLLPMNNVNLDLEGNVETKSTDFAGPGVAASLSHGNMNHKANKLQLKLEGSVEWQWGSTDSTSLGSTSYSVAVNTSYTFPKLLVPFSIVDQTKLLQTKTLINLRYEFTNKVEYYQMTAVGIGLGYQWKKQQKITHVFYPINLNLVNLLETTSEFDSIVNENPYVKKSFEEDFIAGMKYEITFDNSARKAHGLYAQFSLGTAGNLIDLIVPASDEGRPYTIFGNVYSQFIKSSIDLRYYIKSVQKGFVLRFYTGIGYSYGNSTVMPYIEQFYSGGANSLRAFMSRYVGPGSYKPEEKNGIIDQTGDIKLEGNLEYRFPVSEVLMGALFIDAGNVWLLREDTSRLGSGFKFNTFMDQLAVGTGIGLRFDFNFFVLRTDFGLPLRTTYPTNGTNWYSADEIFSKWVFSLAIGYPF